MKVLRREEIVGQAIETVLQTRGTSERRFFDQRFLVKLGNGIVFELVSRDFSKPQPLESVDIDANLAVPVEDRLNCKGRRVIDLCTAYWTPALIVLLDGKEFLWVDCNENGMYLAITYVFSDYAVDLGKTVTFWDQRPILELLE